MSKTYVLDASALLNFVEDGPGAERLEGLFKDARHNGAPLLMSVLNWGEVFYHSWQHRGEESARNTMAGLVRLPIELVPVDVPQILKAGGSRSSTRFLTWIVLRQPCRPCTKRHW